MGSKQAVDGKSACHWVSRHQGLLRCLIGFCGSWRRVQVQKNPIGYIAFLYPTRYISAIYPKGDTSDIHGTHTQTAGTGTQRTAAIAATDAETGSSACRSSAKNDIETGTRHRNRDHRKPLQAPVRAGAGIGSAVKIRPITKQGVVNRATPLRIQAPHRVDE